MIAQIASILNVVDLIFGSAAANNLIGLITGRTQLTDEQKANLDANYRDYAERIQRLKDEQAHAAE